MWGLVSDIMSFCENYKVKINEMVLDKMMHRMINIIEVSEQVAMAKNF